MVGAVMEFRLLGPFEARAGGQPIVVGTRRQERLLLATMLLDLGRIVSIDRLIDLLWAGDPPQSARSAIYTYVGRLRTTLAPHGVVIATRRDGYLIEPAGHIVDATDFVQRAREATDLLDQGERVRRLDAALAMWRGPLLADLADDGLRHRLGAQLTEIRLATGELVAEIRLRMGHHDRVIAALTGPAGQFPTRERLIALLMTALYRGHRQAEAIELYRRTRGILVAELGAEPGADLQDLHVRILRNGCATSGCRGSPPVTPRWSSATLTPGGTARRSRAPSGCAPMPRSPLGPAMSTSPISRPSAGSSRRRRKTRGRLPPCWPADICTRA
jgi:DNA-binding SARP family transcriptional activator